MSQCHQTPGQTILQHGIAVSDRYKDLIGERGLEWRLPSWFTDSLSGLCPSAEIMEQYHVMHDVGKVFCRTVDEEGRQHFPDHARISAAVWRAEGGDKLVGDLIQRDMDMHRLKPSQVEEYDRPELVPALLLTALSELHANAEMFGGIESTSFKIKWKALDKLGRKLLKEKI